MKLWVDDLRQPPGDGWLLARSSAEAIECLRTTKVVEMSLDHDLGGTDSTRCVVLWLCENPQYWPKIVRVHSMNPVGRDYLIGMIYRYSPFLNRSG